ncbi:hypothetical protein TSOC_007264 [Tetrabaena socialis]|uniref:Uncharacterized protein n=1 Tax=Tetrabaena socialis TaxID=47790 RepID=A0A2J8A1G0_9CHLO|nr:hypothetical protein TSOC_007264 [Tetrabaena socialis]|eukprot:PNH06362.1 hypothetical protein TSOC_007264 [Tetrabaena socialis]
MAPLPAPGSARLSRPQAKITAGTISSLRIRPFTRILGAPRKLVLVRAAEPEAPGAVVEEEFSFSLSDAKKGNEYNASDVEAAMRFYAGEGDAPGEVNAEFVENVFGTEDASYFDDMDNNEAYEDEFTAAGIPEAAPKQRQQRRGGEEKDDAGDSDDIAAAKAASQLNLREEEMVLSSEMEEFGLDREKKADTRVVGPAVWDWLKDVDQDDMDDEQLTLLAASTNRTMDADVAAALPTDEEVFADLRNANLQDVDAETRDTIDFLLDDFDIENELKAIPDDGDDVFNVPETSVFNDEDVSRIDALLAEDLALPEMDLEGLSDLAALEDDGLTMSDAAVESYVASLKASEGAELSEEQVKEMFADAPLQLVDVDSEPAVTMDDVDLTEPEIEWVDVSELYVDAIEAHPAAAAAGRGGGGTSRRAAGPGGGR